jgi:putative resolvase
MTVFLTQKEVLETLNITRPTLLRWEEKGIIQPLFLESGHRRYHKDQIEKMIGITWYDKPTSKTCVIYSRVSTKKQQLSGNLERQTQRLIQFAKEKGYHVVEIYEEVASGINENRRQMNRLLRKVSDDDIHIVLAEYKDRIARFGYEYIERYCKSHKTTIELIEQQEEKNLNEEMLQDMISIITSFSARLYGQRGARKIKSEISKMNYYMEAGQDNG